MEKYSDVLLLGTINKPQTDLFLKLNEIFREERIFLNPSLKLAQICDCFQISSKTLGRVLKKKGYRNFTHFVNHHRIEEAKKMMATSEHDIYTLEAIANMAGFGTRQAFYTAFVQITGVKPARYRSLVKYGDSSAREKGRPCKNF